MKNIIINVDDLGISHQVNQAVIRLANLQRISATSYMVGGKVSHAQKQALNQTNIDIGLHLDFTGIFSDTLTNSLPQTILKTYTRQLKQSQVTENIKKQFDIFEDVFGRKPIFVDGHQHVHQFPMIRDALIKELRLRNIPYARVTKPLTNDFKSWVIYALGGQSWKNHCKRNGIKTNMGFAGVYSFDSQVDELRRQWDTWFNSCPNHFNPSNTNLSNTSLIMCHPATPVQDGEPDWHDEIKKAREIEYQWLISDGFEELIKKHQVNIVNWCNITL